MFRWIAVLIWIGWMAPAAQAVAQPSDAGTPTESADPGDERSTTFRPVTGPQAEDVPGGPLLIGAYGAMWLLVLAFVLYLSGRQRRLSRDLERLQKRLGS